MHTTSEIASGVTSALEQPFSHARRPVYQVTFLHQREPRRNKRQFSELNKKLRVAGLCFVSGCLVWPAIIGASLLIFVILFAKAAATVLPVLLAHFP